MNQEQANEDSQQAYSNADKGGSSSDEITPQDSNTTESKKETDTAAEVAETPQISWWNFAGGWISNLWLWIRKDTRSTEWLIVLFTAVLAVTSYLEWQEIKASSIDTHTLADAAGKQATASAEQAGAAKNSVSAMLRAMMTDERAWISPLGTAKTNPPFMRAGQPFFITLDFKNTGKSPALNIVAQNELSRVGSSLACKIEYRPGSRPQRTGVVGPGEAFHGTSVIPIIRPEVFSAFTFQQEVVCAFGIINYEDIYRRPHWITYCLRYTQVLGGQAILLTCPNYNDVDREEKIDY